jgi:hypothetical protein
VEHIVPIRLDLGDDVVPMQAAGAITHNPGWWMVPLPDCHGTDTLLFCSQEMPKYYLFRETPGTRRVGPDTALVVIADRTGENLPKRQWGSWKYLRAITLNRGSGGPVIASHDRAIDEIARKGYYQIRNLPVEAVRFFDFGRERAHRFHPKNS